MSSLESEALPNALGAKITQCCPRPLHLFRGDDVAQVTSGRVSKKKKVRCTAPFGISQLFIQPLAPSGLIAAADAPAYYGVDAVIL